MKMIILALLFCLGITVFITPVESVAQKQFRVFITDETYYGNLGGLAGADFICTVSAHKAGLHGKWKAWLSDSRVSASKRLFHSNFPYVLLNGKIVARNWEDLLTQKENWSYLHNAITINQFGKYLETSNVMTGTNIFGESAGSKPQNFCMNYFSRCRIGHTCTTVFGTSTSIDSDWTITEHESCNEPYHLYCFEQP